jgi:hypothetical protein
VANVMAAIAMAESGGQVGATNQDNNGTTDYGLWQINSSHGYDPSQLTSDPLYNARAAVAVYKSQGFTAWSTYNNGAYQQFLGNAASDTPMFTRPGGGTSGSGGSGGSGSGDGSDMASYLDSYTSSGDSPTDTSVVLTDFLGFKSIGDYINKGLNLATLGLWGDASKVVSTTSDFFTAIVWILNPKHILQAVEFLTGMALMFFGLQAALQGRGEAAEGFQTGESSLSRSGLGRVSRELASAATRKGGGGQRRRAPHVEKRRAPAERRARQERTLAAKESREQRLSQQQRARLDSGTNRY